MNAKSRNRTGETLLIAALLLLVVHWLWNAPESFGRGRAMAWLLGYGAFVALLLPGVIGLPLPRGRFGHALIGVALGTLALPLVWHLAPGPAGAATAPSQREVARLLLTRYLLAVELAALLLATAWVAASASTPATPAAPPAPAATARRLTATALVVLLAFAIAGGAFVLASRAAGLGPVGPAAAILLAAVGLATAAAAQRLESSPDA